MLNGVQQSFDGGFMTAGPGLMSMKGNYIHKNTGQQITVTDNIIDGERGMLVMTNKGAIPMSEFSNNYIQCSEEIYDQSGKVIDKKPVSSDEFKLSKKDRDVLLKGLDTNIPESLSTPVTKTVAKSSNHDIIKKVFDKAEGDPKDLPKIKFDVEWKKFPVSQLKVLIETLDIPTEEISEYFYNTYLDKQSIKEVITAFIEDKLNAK